MRLAALAAAAATAICTGAPLPIGTLQSVGGLPAHIAGSFDDITACEQTASGDYFVFDRRAHAVFTVPASLDARREIVKIGAEPGRVLRPYAFDLAEDGTFVVADAPGNRGRIQEFLASGSSIGGFTLPGRQVPFVVMEELVLSGLGTVEYTGRSVLISQPETGSLVTEYAMNGGVLRTFGELRATGQEQDPDVHTALNAGIAVLNPKGGFYYVFLAGIPMFRKYDAKGTLVIERHIEGVEIDDYIRNIPTRWPRRRTPDSGELPIVRPGVRAAAADRDGNLWISLSAPYTYVYDPSGDKIRIVQFRAAGIISPRALFFTADHRVLITPGCYAFRVN
jgi:hypothetical protein